MWFGGEFRERAENRWVIITRVPLLLVAYRRVRQNRVTGRHGAWGCKGNDVHGNNWKFDTRRTVTEIRNGGSRRGPSTMSLIKTGQTVPSAAAARSSAASGNIVSHHRGMPPQPRNRIQTGTFVWSENLRNIADGTAAVNSIIFEQDPINRITLGRRRTLPLPPSRDPLIGPLPGLRLRVTLAGAFGTYTYLYTCSRKHARTRYTTSGV